ncbi:MAG: tetratricopeptide repeat protein [Planctomycetota bacterium]
MVQEILRTRQTNAETHLKAALQRLDQACPQADAADVRTWPEWDLLEPHVVSAVREGHRRSIATPTARLMRQPGRLLEARAQFPEAEPLLRTALVLSEQHGGPNHPEVAADLNNLAELLRGTNRLPEAERLYRRALQICESNRPHGLHQPIL